MAKVINRTPINRRPYDTQPSVHVPNPAFLIAARVMLVLALVSMLLLTIVQRVLKTTELVYTWIYFILYALPIILLLGALTCRLQYGIQSTWPRRIAVFFLIFVILAAGSIAYSLISAYMEFGMTPVSYYTDEGSGHKIVIMKGIDSESYAQAVSDAGGEAPDSSRIIYLYGAYALENRLLFHPLLGGDVMSYTGVDYVSWSDDGQVADVTIYDTDDVEQHIIVDFGADEQALLEAYQAEQAQEAEGSADAEAEDASDGDETGAEQAEESDSGADEP